MDVYAALMVGLVLMGAKFLDWTCSSQLSRPIVCVPVLGLLLGHPQEGLTLAAEMELIFIGNVSLGGVMPSDITMGAIFGSAFAMILGQNVSVAVTLAVPLSALGTLLYSCMKIVVTMIVPRFEILLTEHKVGSYKRLWFAQAIVFVLCYFVLGFVCTLAGQPVVQAFVDALPTWLQKSLTVASTMLPALGLALLLKQLYTPTEFPYFFVGFGAIAFFSYNNVTAAALDGKAVNLTSAPTPILTLVELALFGGALAALVIFNEFRKINEKKAAHAISASSDESEDFFND
ncbi:phosphotransferase system PTS sorbose-specific IIC subunit [Coriobacterium glomerans PW2]|uniref:Phosphotransferase system PTS sorbose-specific IIC subunit n=1 Tax=Coriobacterium glomerans (strain ATCC 49209 / DSM 20642 / JCM 10262 / PW2) TaxID=700015 RepID=F2NB26_CORGP|nr:PTS sugar transporter subunit IIC [Coriobacterium glomerans]AEB07777.1 phosphotransferase system PTS sorbose-specific IIC subunit [Coriobacterium glomerans PW2]